MNYCGFNRKLSPKMTNLFLVLTCTQTSCYIRQYSNQSKLDEIKKFLEQLEKPINESRKIINSFQIEKVDKTELKRIKALVLTLPNSK